MGARPHSHILAGLVAEHGWRTGAEIGVFKGGTLFLLLDRFPELEMLGVDQWLNFDREHYTRFDMPAIGRKVRRRARDYPQRCRILHMDRLTAAQYVPDGSLDFVFVDALHEYEPVRADLAAWIPKVRPGGYMTGHDTHWESVRRALDEALPGWIGHEASVWSRRIDAGSE